MLLEYCYNQTTHLSNSIQSKFLSFLVHRWLAVIQCFGELKHLLSPIVHRVSQEYSFSSYVISERLVALKILTYIRGNHRGCHPGLQFCQSSAALSSFHCLMFAV